MPLFTIITVTYNAEDFIENSIKSVLAQTYQDYEYIIVDGESTDRTLSIIKAHDSVKVKIISEKDKGIYDAMNKGLDIAKGDYIIFIGADDALADKNVLGDVASHITGKNPDFVSGKITYDSGHQFFSGFGFKTLLNNTIHHQGVFYQRSLFRSFRYDTNYKLIADYELNLNLYIKRGLLNYIFIDRTISICKEGGVSRLHLQRARQETNQIRQKVLGKNYFFLKWIYLAKFFLTKYVI